MHRHKSGNDLFIYLSEKANKHISQNSEQYMHTLKSSSISSITEYELLKLKCIYFCLENILRRSGHCSKAELDKNKHIYK